jgi:hypothetical protein
VVREASDREPSRLGLEEAFEHLGRLGAGTSSLPNCFEHGSSSGVFDLATKVVSVVTLTLR